MSCLYKLSSPSGKSYIGITSLSLERRWRQHKYNAAKGRGVRSGEECLALYSAMRKYGTDGFIREVISVADDWDTLCRLEREAIAAHGTFAPGGYNLTLGGEGTLGAIPSDDARQKMSEAQRARVSDPAHRAALLDSLEKAVEARRVKWWARTPEERRVWGQAHGEKVRRGHATPESRVRTSAAAKRLWADPAMRAKMLKGMTGCKRAPWTDARKQQAALKRRQEWADPELRAKRLAGFAWAKAKQRVT